MYRPLVLTCVFVAACLDAGAEDDQDDLMNQAFENAQGDGKADGGCSGVVVPDRNGFDKHVALTFDDGPNPATTPQIIAILKKHHAPATFFNNGIRYAVAGAKELAAQIAADPDYLLGNHSQHHLDLSKESATKVASEVALTDTLIRAAGETPKYFRFPFGAASCAAKAHVEGLGYTVVGWHIDSADWCYAAGHGTCKKATFKYVPDALRSDMLGYVMSQVHATNGGVILFHDIHQSTADHLDAVLTAMEHAGFSFVRLDDASVFPRLAHVSPKFIGDSCAADTDCTFSGGRCHPAGFCTVACNGTCADATGKASTFCMADDITADTGMCVSKAAAQNQSCALLPDTEARVVSRFVGTSASAPATANVCAPR